MNAARAHAATPWSRVDALTALVLVAVGAVVWAVGWYRVADQPAFDEQVAPLNIAIAGIVIVGAGQVSWFLGGRRAVHQRRRVLLGTDAAPQLPAGEVRADDAFFAGTERFFHRLDCTMVGDRAWAPSPRTTHLGAGRVPCGVCAP